MAWVYQWDISVMDKETVICLIDAAGLVHRCKEWRDYNLKTDTYEDWYVVYLDPPHKDKFGMYGGYPHKTRGEAYTCAWNAYIGIKCCK